MLIIAKKHSTTPPHSVWSGALIKHTKRNIFTFQICCISKAPLSVAYALNGAGRQRSAYAEMSQMTNGWLGIRSAWKPIIIANMRASELYDSTIK